MRALGYVLGGTFALFCTLGIGCNSSSEAEPDLGTGGTGGSTAGKGVGDACADSGVCRVGLTCTSGTCQLGHSATEGTRCVAGGECESGLQCVAGQTGNTCQPAGTAGLDEGCQADRDCESGLRCSIVGFGAQCTTEGSADQGQACTTSSDCLSGLFCKDLACVPQAFGVPSFGVPSFSGVTCDPPSTGSVRAFFEVPGAPDAATGDFFRLPFPNDARVSGGKIDLTGFPTPGTALLGWDPVQRYVDAVVADETGWGTNGSVIFRFSGPLDYATLNVAGNPALFWVDLTQGTPEYGRGDGLSWYASEGGTKYICHNWVGVRRRQGFPMLPGHTYGVWIQEPAKAKGGGSVQRSENFNAVMASAAPSDAKLAAVHASYAPLRAYLASESIDPNLLLTATVITVGPKRDLMHDLAAAVAAAPVPTAKNWVKCGAGAVSPCPDAAGDRACGNGDPAYDEYHALVTLPIFQQGAAPYAAAPDGKIQTNAPVRNEDVCLSLTLPKSAAPAGGWPLVVFAHGTGGSFRSHVSADVAGVLASNALHPAAVLGIDQVEHGPRRGGSTKSPNELFFNFANPDAARGNPLQGAADQLALARFAAALDVSAAETGGDAIKIDPAGIVFFGHSQGSTHGSLALPYTDLYQAAVLSGNGASLTDALLTKTAPVNIAAAVPLVVGDFDSAFKLASGDHHPVLSVLQQWIDPADPLNFARAARNPEGTLVGKSIFQTYGLGDTFSPPKTMADYAIAADLAHATADSSAATPDTLSPLQSTALPIVGNATVGGRVVTLAVRQYGPPSGKDGHFVAFDVPSANADVVRFLAMAAGGETPSLGQ